jgi:hypothetical protein
MRKKAAHPQSHLGLGPVDPVVEGAGPEQRREAECVDAHREGRLRRLGEDDQGDAEPQREEEGPLMGDAAQFRLDRGDRLGGRLFGRAGTIAHRLFGGGGSLPDSLGAPE